MSSAPSDQEIDIPALSPEKKHDPYAAFRGRDFRLFLIGNMLALFGLQMQTFAVSWEVYERTRSNLALAWVGFVQVLPVIGLFLPAGHLVDRLDRRRLLMASIAGAALCSVALAWNSWHDGELWVSYACLLFIGASRAFLQPARSAFLPQIVAREHFSNAVTWNSGGFQLATILGPVAGGFFIAWFGTAWGVYLLNAVLACVFLGALAAIRSRPVVRETEPPSLKSLAAGLSFVWHNKLILGAITLDMFAVLLGGATMMLPVYAKEILHVEPDTLGWMRGAPGAGALQMALILAHRPPIQRAGPALLWSVAGFGVATIVFGLSRRLDLSLLMLFSLGALDMISVVIRHTLVQLQTPDAMRGRVSAVNGMFIGISNELGEAESGFVAWLFDRPGDRAFGPTVSVAGGGIGTLLVVAIVSLVWPQVRRYGRLDSHDPS